MTDSAGPSALPGLPGRPPEDPSCPRPGAGGFHAYAVISPFGPHVTLQAATAHLGRHWTTTTPRSAKARAVRRLGWASATAPMGAGWRLIAGPAVILDLAHPTTLTRDVVASGLAGGALLRLGLGSLGQLVGYPEAARSVPLGFLPVGRVVARFAPEDRLADRVGRSVALQRTAARRPANAL